jgi:hypothetical protein
MEKKKAIPPKGKPMPPKGKEAPLLKAKLVFRTSKLLHVTTLKK